MELIPNEKSLTKMKKKSTESFREYAIRLHEQATRVKSPIKESKIVEVFIQVQDETYYQHLLPALGNPFIDVLKMWEIIKDRIKIGRILKYFRCKKPTSLSLHTLDRQVLSNEVSSYILGQACTIVGSNTDIYYTDSHVQRGSSRLHLQIIPQSICTRYGLTVGATVEPLVHLLLWLFFPISYPISKVLDWMLDKGHAALLRRAELKIFCSARISGYLSSPKQNLLIWGFCDQILYAIWDNP
ncbi:DUF21 domain-containing protein [Capsicum baccatum]|uniref:DUF21 domain-containing protein n=1 Tax=Capsicum baccatum TaxID=33114 RepID=A0A2G2XBN7_CAPBA|nr:DUF21 domain-containing protein [Capsicum baccatum]